MSKITIHFLQPIASYLGFHKPGGFKLEAEVNAPGPLRNAIASLRVNGLNILQQLQSERIKIMVTINGLIKHAGLEADVQDGDEVSILPLIGGG